MIEWEAADERDRLEVVDADNTELSVRGTAFEVVGPGPDLARPVDATVEASALELQFPHAIVYVSAMGSDEQYELDPRGDSLALPPDEYVIDIDTEIKTYLRFYGRAWIYKTDDLENVVVRFSDRRRAILGFRSRHELPAGTVTVPATPEGLAAGISVLSSSHKTDGPERSYPTLRGHPPLLETGDERSIPDRIERDRPDSGVELVVPAGYEQLFVTAPLAYYLQATVRTADRERPVLRIDDRSIEHELSARRLERDVERLLRKTFFLDCLVRNAGPYGTNLSELSLLDALEFDAEALYEADPRDRLATYLDVPYAAVEHRLPDWHLSTYVDPEPATIETLPFLLDRLSMIYLPRTSELEGSELIERSLEDFYRGPDADRTESESRTGAESKTRATAGSESRTGGEPGAGTDTGSKTRTTTGSGDVASVDIVKPALRGGKVHGWIADGVPIDVFTSAPESFTNRLDFLERDTDATSIVVVLNDPEMEAERTDVAEIYQQRSEDLTIDVTVEEGVRTAALARIFEADHDFVHYIGHCETEGMRCPDGYLSAASLDRCGVQTFFLNACGSFYEGMTLVEKGSVAGAVTFAQVLNDHAVKVGSTFAKLLVHGFSIERAMGIARRRIMMGKDYAVVGDGTHSLTQSTSRVPTTATLERLDGDEFALALECFSTRETGSYYFPHVDDNEFAYLCGTESNFVLDRSELATFLEESETPVIYDGDVYWSRELSARFDP